MKLKVYNIIQKSKNLKKRNKYNFFSILILIRKSLLPNDFKSFKESISKTLIIF